MESEDSYFMNKRIYLYGCNHRSEVVFGRIKASGVRVTAFVDKSKKGANIINPQELELVDDKDNVCIYICMQNAMQHEIVADMLFSMGFHYIVFLPVSSKYNMQAYKMVELWNRIYEYGINSSIEIPRYETFIMDDKSCKNNIVYAPMELVFTNNANFPWYEKWSDKHISLYEVYNQLYRYIYMGGDRPYIYLQDNFKLLCKEKQSTLRDRVILYESLSARINNDSLYYQNMICPVEVSESGVFNLKDGHHRANLAFHLGKDFLPVKIHGGEVNYKWLNDFMQHRNYKLFLLLSDIVLFASDFVSCRIFSVDNISIIKKYMKLLAGNEIDILVTNDMQHMNNADLQIIFKRSRDDVIGNVYIYGKSSDLSYMKPSYVFDNCIYHVHINEGDINDFA